MNSTICTASVSISGRNRWSSRKARHSTPRNASGARHAIRGAYNMLSLLKTGIDVLRQEGFASFAQQVFLKLVSARSRSPLQSGLSSPEAYRRWAEAHDRTPAQLDEQRARVASFAYQPLFSIITPVYNP